MQLAELTGADKKDIAAAFGTDAATFWRWRQAYAGARAGRAAAGQARAERAVEADAAGDGADPGAGRGRVAVAGGDRPPVRGVGVRGAYRAGPGRHPPGRGAGGGRTRAPAALVRRLPGWEQEGLPVLPDPVPRDGERVLARFGLLGEGAVPVFTPGAKVPLAGLLLALPALAGTGLLETARAVYGRLRDGFYGLETVLVLLVFLALLREPRAEGATRVPPAALGRVLGLDRAPEVKTIRRKLGELAAAGKAAELQLAIARHHAALRPDDLGFLYIDGHTRAYFGDPGRAEDAPGADEAPRPGHRGDLGHRQPRRPDAGGDRPSRPRRWPPRSRTCSRTCAAVCGEGTRPVLCFDRGGWSADLFAEIIAAGFGLLTYRKNQAGKDIPDLDDDAFTVMTWTGDDGRDRSYDLADTTHQAARHLRRRTRARR